jgi:amidohydrolase
MGGFSEDVKEKTEQDGAGMGKYEKVLKRAEEMKETLVQLRRDFHQHPEVGLRTFGTGSKIEKFLKELGLETGMLVNGAGVRGVLRGKVSGKAFALRADIDALPLQEENEIPYKSLIPGVMHGCGHDAHTAMLLGAAAILSELKNELEGNVVFLFQPGEETGEGAKAMVEEGALEGVDAIFGVHVSTTFDSGTLGYRSGPLMAAGDFFDVKITGKGGHGALPHEAIDPIVISANAINALQTIISREVSPLESAVLSICKMEAGKGAYNVIPDFAVFGGTIRSSSHELRKSIPRRIKEILDGVVPSLRGGYEFNLMERFPPTLNDEKMTSLVAGVARELLGREKVSEIKPMMASEDFSCYLQGVPGTFVFLGVNKRERETVFPHHHPRFNIDEGVLPFGTALEVAVTMQYLKGNG